MSASRLIVISAPSGAGKTSLCERLLKEFTNVTLSVSTTTRSKRPNEAEGVHYHFVTLEDFQRKIDAKQFAEWAKVHGNLYGTSRATIDGVLQSGRHVLFDIDVQGAMSLRRQYPHETLLIFILPPSLEALEKRLLDRKGDNEEAIRTRLHNAQQELSFSSDFDYQVVNDNFEHAYAQIKTILEKELV